MFFDVDLEDEVLGLDEDAYINPGDVVMLDEVYFGVTPDIQECIDIIHEYRNKYIRRASLDTMHMYVPGCNDDKLLNKLSNKFEDIFGIIYDINIYATRRANAYTMPIIYNLGIEDPAKHIHSTSKGWKVDPELKYCSSLNVAGKIMFDEGYSDREVMAVMLHEIGHSFVQIQSELRPIVANVRGAIIITAMINAIIYFLMHNYTKSLQQIVDLIHTTNGAKKFVAIMNRFVRSNPITRGIGTLTDAVFGTIKTCTQDAYSLIYRITGINSIMKAITVYSNKLFNKSATQKKQARRDYRTSNAYGRSMEYLADNFAADYGLGAEQVSALQRLTFNSDEDWIDKVGVINPINTIIEKMVNEPYYELISTIDAHPSLGERSKYLKEELERELKKKEYNPKIKAEIKRSIEAIDQSMEAIHRLAKEKEKDPDGYVYVINALFLDDHEMSDSERGMTDWDERDKFYKDNMKENADAGLIDLTWMDFE